MKKENKIIISVIAVIIVLTIIVVILNKIKLKNNAENVNNEKNLIAVNDEYIQIDKNQISYQNNVDINELKQDSGKTGNSDIYEVQTEYDGRKTLQVKANLKYKVAFAGLIKNSKPSESELDDIYSKNMPLNSGIWVEKSSRNKIQDYFNNSGLFNSKYEIGDDGYLKLMYDSNLNDNDKKIKNIIDGNKQYIFDVSSVCYIVDDVTGEFLDYNFEKMDEYQTYEYFEDNNKMIVFINENKNNQMSDKEIFESVINLL